jgi:glycosyltransferase involved in cell wall biosynthesis
MTNEDLRMDGLVSVVIPTYQRPDLVKRAVQCVLNQTYRNVEAIVVIDGTDPHTRGVLDDMGDRRVRVIETGTNKGPSNARNFGVEHAKGVYVALLDDDDEWLDTKIERQMALVHSEGLRDKPFIVSCRVLATTETTQHVWPSQLYVPGTDFSGYLIDRPGLFGRPGIIHTSSILVPRSLAQQIRFLDDEDHEDWTWLLQCVVDGKAEVRMCEEPLSYYHLNLNVSSRSKRANWKATFDWAMTYRRLLSPRAFAAILATKAAVKAKRQGQLRALARIAVTLLRQKQTRLVHWIQFIGIVFLPVSLTSRLRLMSFSKG